MACGRSLGLFSLMRVCSYCVHDTLTLLCAQESMQSPGFYQKNPFCDPGFFQFCWTLSNAPPKSICLHISTQLSLDLTIIHTFATIPGCCPMAVYKPSLVFRAHPPIQPHPCVIQPKHSGKLTTLPPAGRPSRGCISMNYFPQAPLPHIFHQPHCYPCLFICSPAFY